jgi:hypothetical protein
MASEAELRLGRLAVKRKLVTEEQVLGALHARNRDPKGDLGEQLVTLGMIKRPDLDDLRARVERGEGREAATARQDRSTDHEISLTGVRETLARDQLEVALVRASRDKKGALAELERLAKEFPDTESGVKAALEAKRLRG